MKGNTEDKIADMIASLPEIIKADAYCKRASHGERHLVTYVAEDPDGENGNYYWVKVVENNGTAYHTWYNFLVESKTYKIKYMDPLSGKDIPLAIWRKQKNYLGLN